MSRWNRGSSCLGKKALPFAELYLAFECPSRSRDHIQHVRIRNITLYSKVSTRTKVEVTD